jgi:hypothetical protein
MIWHTPKLNSAQWVWEVASCVRVRVRVRVACGLGAIRATSAAQLCSQLRESCGCSSGGGAHLLHVLGHDVHRPAELLGRAELDHLGSGVEDRVCPGQT